MSLSDAHKTIAAVVFIAGVSVAGFTYFQPRAAAAAEKEAIKQEIKKSADDLRVEIIMNRVGELNTKKAKEKLTPAEETELDLSLKQVAAIMAERAKK